MFAGMKYALFLLTLCLLSCGGSRNSVSTEKKDYTPFIFFDGDRARMVYQSDISHVLHAGASEGTIVLKNGRTHAFESLGTRPERSRADQEYNNRQQYMHQIEAYARQRNPEYTSGLQPN